MEDEDNVTPAMKRRRSEKEDDYMYKREKEDMGKEIIISEVNREENGMIRTSCLSSPTLRLTGHKGSIYALAYDPTGECLCSGSFDMQCYLWNAGSGTYENYNVLTPSHKNAVLDLSWSTDAEQLITGSADTTVGLFDAATGTRVRKFIDHSGIVNAVDASKGNASLICSGSDDKTSKVWDSRVSRKHVLSLDHSYQVTAVAFSIDGAVVYTGGIDNCIHAWDVRNTSDRTMTMHGHSDTVTSLALHPNGTHLLSNSMDGTIRSWDIRPFVENHSKRLVKMFFGATHDAQKALLNCAWSADGTMVTGGSADRVVHIWDHYTAQELYYLPGHSGSVNCVVFHPKENVIASASSDKTIFVGELAQ